MMQLPPVDPELYLQGARRDVQKVVALEYFPCVHLFNDRAELCLRNSRIDFRYNVVENLIGTGSNRRAPTKPLEKRQARKHEMAGSIFITLRVHLGCNISLPDLRCSIAS